MAGGPFFPVSIAYPSTGNAFPGIISGGTNARQWHCTVLSSSIAADVTVELEWAMPNNLPSGTAKLQIETRSNATSGSCNLTPSWVSIAEGENFDTISLNSEGSTNISHGAGDNDDRKIAKVTLDADTVVAGETIRMHIVWATSGFTYTNITGWQFSIIWE